MNGRKDIRTEDLISLKSWMEEHGFPSYRAAQLYHWIWVKGVSSFEAMTNMPGSLRQCLEKSYVFKRAEIAVVQRSSDKTIKVAFKLYDGNQVEGVLIPAGDRMTACVSSQVGCSLDCKFCATGFMTRKRNIEAAEIVDQVRLLDRLASDEYGKGLSNIVYMGMGEPLLNYKELVRSIQIITSKEGMGMSPQRITVSTAGIAKMIVKLADEDLGIHLALSLHAATNEKRSALMPINDSNNLETLAESMRYFYEHTGNRPTLEYSVIESVNDGTEDLEELAAYARKFPCKINLIEYNPIAQADFVSSSESRIDRFAQGLRKYGLIVNVRRSRGKDIDAACGQLAIKDST